MSHNKAEYNHWRKQIFFVTWLAYIGLYLTRKAFPVVKDNMLTDSSLGLTKPDLGTMDFCFLLCYAIGQFIMGVYGDRFGPRKVFICGMLGSLLIAGMIGSCSTLWIFFVLFSLHGFAQATGWAPLSKNLTCWFVQKERGWIMGWWSTNYTIGGSLAAILAGGWAEYFLHWRYAFLGAVLAVAIIWFLFILLQKDKPEDVGLSSQELERLFGEQTSNTVPTQNIDTQKNIAVISTHTSSLAKQKHKRPWDHYQAKKTSYPKDAPQSWADTIVVLKNPIVWLLGVIYFCLKPIRYMIFFWGPLYLKEYLQTGTSESAMLSTGFEWGGFIGVISAGYVSDYVFQSRRLPFSILCLFGLGLLLFFFHPIVCTGSSILAFIALGAMGFLLYVPDSLLSGSAAMDFGTKRGASTATGLVNGCGSFGAMIGGSIPGWFEGSQSWGLAFIILGCMMLLCAIILIPFWNAKPKSN